MNGGVLEPTSTATSLGEMVTLPTAAGLTVSVAALLVFPSLDAVIDVVPVATPVATPELGSIVATDVLLELNVTVRPVSTLPLASLVTAVNAGVDCPTTTDCVVGEITTEPTGTAFTTMVAVPVLPSLVAVTVIVPGDSAVTRPLLE